MDNLLLRPTAGIAMRHPILDEPLAKPNQFRAAELMRMCQGGMETFQATPGTAAGCSFANIPVLAFRDDRFCSSLARRRRTADRLSLAHRCMMRAPRNPEEIAMAFARIADRIQKRTGCSRVEALLRAIDGYPAAYERYCAAIETSDSPRHENQTPLAAGRRPTW